MKKIAFVLSIVLILALLPINASYGLSSGELTSLLEEMATIEDEELKDAAIKILENYVIDIVPADIERLKYAVELLMPTAYKEKIEEQGYDYDDVIDSLSIFEEMSESDVQEIMDLMKAVDPNENNDAIIGGIEAIIEQYIPEDEEEPQDTGGSSGGGGGGGDFSSDGPESFYVSIFSKIINCMDGNVVLRFEKGSFRDKAELTVSKSETDALANSDLKLVGETYEFEITEALQKMVELILKYEDEDVMNVERLGVYYYDEINDSWDFLGGTVDGDEKTVTVEIEKFSKYALMEFIKEFSDLENHWAKEDIGQMAALYIVDGMTETEFMPEENITRAQFATLLARASGLELTAEASAFDDVADDAWFGQYVMTTYRAGIVNGMNDHEFAPNEKITREQMAVMIMRANKIMTGEDFEGMEVQSYGVFADETDCSDWAKQAVLKAYDKGIIKGMTENTFQPKANATRAQGVVMIRNLLENK